MGWIHELRRLSSRCLLAAPVFGLVLNDAWGKERVTLSDLGQTASSAVSEVDEEETVLGARLVSHSKGTCTSCGVAGCADSDCAGSWTDGSAGGDGMADGSGAGGDADELMQFADPGDDYGSMYASLSSAPNLPGYIDSAVIRDYFRVRFDAAYNNPFADRAEFFYAQCGCFGGNARGPGNAVQPAVATSVDYQELSAYLERAVSRRLSVFVEMPFRWLNAEMDPAVNGLPGFAGAVPISNSGGLSDINAGFKYLLRETCDSLLTFQLRVYTPSGDAGRGLGTGHVSLEPALLGQRTLSDRMSIFGEFRAWIPISDAVNPLNGESFDGSVLRYGAGASYLLSESCSAVTGPAGMECWNSSAGRYSTARNSIRWWPTPKRPATRS